MVKKDNVIMKDVVWPSFELETINQEARSARTTCVKELYRVIHLKVFGSLTGTL
jgi:hypothetical protein